MNSDSNKTTIVSLLALAFGMIALTSHGQNHYTQGNTSRISIAGTSTMHDWTMTTDKATYDAVFETIHREYRCSLPLCHLRSLRKPEKRKEWHGQKRILRIKNE